LIEPNKPVAWITGAGGLIGNYLVRTASRVQVIALNRPALDLTNFEVVRRRFKEERPDLVVHCAAISKSAACEANPELARRVNVEVTRTLADLASAIPLMFFSTDLVFDGRQGWYSEADAVNPVTVYAETKAAAEEIVLGNPLHSVVRTGPNVGCSPSGDRAFNEELQRAAEQGRPMRLFTDEFRCPIPAEETARVVWDLLGRDARGLFHVAGSERLSRWEIGQLLLKTWSNVNSRFEPGSIRDYQGPKRSPDTSLNCSKVTALLGREMPRLSDWLRKNRG